MPISREHRALLAHFLTCCLFSIGVGAIVADPSGVAGRAFVIFVGVLHALSDSLGSFGLLTGLFAILGLGLYALHVVCGLMIDTVVWLSASPTNQPAPVARVVRRKTRRSR